MSAHKVLYFDVRDVYVDAWSIMHADRCQVKYNRQNLNERTKLNDILPLTYTNTTNKIRYLVYLEVYLF
jgi:hypothetical protein